MSARATGWAFVGVAAAILVGFFSWEWYLSPTARVRRVLHEAADAAEATDRDRFLSVLSDDYGDFVHHDRGALEERLNEAFARVDRTNVTLSGIDVEVAGSEATAGFDLVVVAVRGEERYVVLGAPFDPERLTATLARGPDGWKIRRVDRGGTGRDEP
jgi:hypothetical protein